MLGNRGKKKQQKNKKQNWDHDWLFLLHEVQEGFVLRQGVLTLSGNILRENSWPMPKQLGCNNLHKRREIRTQEA